VVSVRKPATKLVQKIFRITGKCIKFIFLRLWVNFMKIYSFIGVARDSKINNHLRKVLFQ